MFVASISSGSNGNCYYVGNGEEAVLIDAGISCREFDIRMQRLNLSPGSIKAIFVSHEHSDHIFGLPVISKKYHLPVYITPATRQHGRLKLQEELCRSFAAMQPVQIGSLSVLPFTKLHDAADPHSFTIECNGIKIGIFTDLGRVCSNLVGAFRNCHAAFLESNYDEELLANGRYPVYLKNRIRGGQGHLSNVQALELFRQHKSEHLSHLFLSHLSKDNNSPEIAENLFRTHAGNTQIIVATRYSETAVYEIRRSTIPTQQPAPAPVTYATGSKLHQLALF